MKKKLLFLYLLTITNASYSLTCPDIEQIKNVELIKANQHRFDPTLWHFTSNTFNHATLTWYVDFGTFFPNAKTEEEALKAGRLYFEKINPLILHPKPDHLPNNVLLCDYMPTGREFFLSAVSQPEKI